MLKVLSTLLIEINIWMYEVRSKCMDIPMWMWCHQMANHCCYCTCTEKLDKKQIDFYRTALY